MDGGDILYIVFVIVSILFGALGKARKKKKAQPVQYEQNRNEDNEFNWEDLLESYSSTKEDVQEKYEPVEDVAPKSEKISRSEPIIDEKRPLTKTKTQNSLTPSQDIIFDEDDNEANSEIDLRQAIIYSEILKRPEY